jgi:3-methyladenine DNA glycosylase/8-oxoguanine DNA glycosylase
MRSITLRPVDELSLPVQSPFHFRLTLWKPSHFRTGLEQHSPTVTWRTFRLQDRLCAVRMTMLGENLEVRVFAAGRWDQKLRERLQNRLDVAYGLSENITDFLRQAKAVPATSQVVKSMLGMKMSCPESLFEISVISLLLQNTTIQRSTQMMSHLLDRYGAVVQFDTCKLRSFFSAAEMLRVGEPELREHCRLGYRAKYFPRFAEFFAAVDDDELRTMPAEKLLPQLQSIKGVGPYTANIITSHAMRDRNVIPLDVWNRKLLSQVLLGKADADAKTVRECCNSLFPGNAGLAALYLIEHRYLKEPLDPLLPDKSPLNEITATSGGRKTGRRRRE